MGQSILSVKSQLLRDEGPRANSSLTPAPRTTPALKQPSAPLHTPGPPPPPPVLRLVLLESSETSAVSRRQGYFQARAGWGGAVLGQEGVRPREGTGQGKGPQTDLSS